MALYDTTSTYNDENPTSCPCDGRVAKGTPVLSGTRFCFKRNNRLSEART